MGQGSKRALGRPAQTEATLDLSGLAGVTLYEPEELVLSAKAGTPPPHRVYFAAVTAEEQGLLGSYRRELVVYRPPQPPATRR